MRGCWVKLWMIGEQLCHVAIDQSDKDPKWTIMAPEPRLRAEGTDRPYREGGTLMIYYCARCGKPIPRGKEMMEKMGGRLVPTHMDCRERYSRKTLDQMIHEALDKGPGNELRRKMRGRNG